MEVLYDTFTVCVPELGNHVAAPIAKILKLLAGIFVWARKHRNVVSPTRVGGVPIP